MSNLKQFFLEIDSVALSFWQKGEGNKVLVCTHGFRQDKSQFLPLFKTIPSGWVVLAFDQPAHGETRWEDRDYCFDSNFMGKLWGKLISLYPHSEWSLAGFSMGGKTAMMLHRSSPFPIKNLILIAPGGVYTTPLNRFFSYNSIGKLMFHYFIDNPIRVMKVVDYSYKRKWIRTFQYRFIKAHLTNPEAGYFLKKFTDIYRRFDFSFPAYGKFTQATQTHILLIWGKQDEVVTIDQSLLFQKHIPNAGIYYINGKHNLIEEYPDEIKSLIYNIIL